MSNRSLNVVPWKCLQLVYHILEYSAAMFVALKLIEARAGGRQQNDFPRFGFGVRLADGGLEGSALLHREAVPELAFDFVRRRSDQQDSPRLLLEFIL